MKPAKILAATVPVLLAGCPEPENDDWMIGVFSSGQPGISFDGAFERYRIEEDGTATYEYEPPLGYSRSRTWERRGANAIMIFPGPDDEESTRERNTWKITRKGRCGPYEFDIYLDGEDQNPSSSGHVYAGELCVRELPGPCNGECDCCELYWCEAPPPCE